MEKMVSRIATPRSEESRLESLSDPSRLSGLDENDPKSLARWMKKMGKEMGEDMGEDFNQAVEEAIEESAALASVTVSLEAILLAIEMMLTRVFSKIGPLEMGLRSLTLRTRTWNAENWERTIQFKEPSMDIKSALARVKRVLEDYPQPGPVEEEDTVPGGRGGRI